MNESGCDSATTGCHTKAQHFDKDKVYKELQTFLEVFLKKIFLNRIRCLLWIFLQIF